MTDLASMEVVEGLQNLVHDEARFGRVHMPMRVRMVRDKREQVAAGA